MNTLNLTSIFYFSLGLPLGAEWWFGIGILQTISNEVLRHSPFNFVTSLGYYEISISLIILMAFLIYTRNSPHCSQILLGFLSGAILQPYFFMIYYLIGILL